MHGEPSTQDEEDDGAQEERTDGDTDGNSFVNTRITTVLGDDNSVTASRSTSGISDRAVATLPEIIAHTSTGFTVTNTVAVAVVGARGEGTVDTVVGSRADTISIDGGGARAEGTVERSSAAGEGADGGGLETTEVGTGEITAHDQVDELGAGGGDVSAVELDGIGTTRGVDDDDIFDVVDGVKGGLAVGAILEAVIANEDEIDVVDESNTSIGGGRRVDPDCGDPEEACSVIDTNTAGVSVVGVRDGDIRKDVHWGGGVVDGGQHVLEVDAAKPLDIRVELRADGFPVSSTVVVDQLERLSRVDEQRLDEGGLDGLGEGEGERIRGVTSGPVATTEPFTDEGSSTSNDTSGAGGTFGDGGGLTGSWVVGPGAAEGTGGIGIVEGGVEAIGGSEHIRLDAVVISGTTGSVRPDSLFGEEESGAAGETGDDGRTAERSKVREATAAGRGTIEATGRGAEGGLVGGARGRAALLVTKDGVVVGGNVTNGTVAGVLGLGEGIGVVDVIRVLVSGVSIERTTDTNGVLGRGGTLDAAGAEVALITDGEDGNEILLVEDKVIKALILDGVEGLGAGLGDGGTPREETDTGIEIVDNVEQAGGKGIEGDVEDVGTGREDVHDNELGTRGEAVEDGVGGDVGAAGAATSNTGGKTGNGGTMAVVVLVITKGGDVGDDFAAGIIEVIVGNTVGVLEETVVTIKTGINEGDDLTGTSERSHGDGVVTAVTTVDKGAIGGDVVGELAAGQVDGGDFQEADALRTLAQNPGEDLLLELGIVDGQEGEVRVVGHLAPAEGGGVEAPFHALGEGGDLLTEGRAVHTLGEMNNKLVVFGGLGKVEGNLVDVRHRTNPDHARVGGDLSDQVARSIQDIGGDGQIIIQNNMILILEFLNGLGLRSKHGFEGHVKQSKLFRIKVGMTSS